MRLFAYAHIDDTVRHSNLWLCMTVIYEVQESQRSRFFYSSGQAMPLRWQLRMRDTVGSHVTIELRHVVSAGSISGAAPPNGTWDIYVRIYLAVGNEVECDI